MGTYSKSAQGKQKNYIYVKEVNPVVAEFREASRQQDHLLASACDQAGLAHHLSQPG